MASVYYLIDDAQDIADNVIANTAAKFDLDKKRFFAALLIQRTFRGFVVRNEYKKWWNSAVTIQRHVRGFLLRIHLPEIAEELFRRKCLSMFIQMATKIQAFWRGYCVRKRIRISEIIEQKKAEQEELATMQRIFIEVFKKRMVGSSDFSICLEELPEHVRHLNKIIKKSPDIIESLFDRHHLLRTYQTEGVLSVHDSKELSSLEKFLKRFDYKPYMNNVRKIFKTSPSPDIAYMFTDKRTRKMEDLFRMKNHRDGPLKKVGNIDKYTDKVVVHDVPFKMVTKLAKKPYERKLYSQDDYTGVKQPVFRDIIKPDILEHDFDLDVHHMEKNPKEEPPYLINHWKKTCCNHNFMYDFMEK